MPDPDALDHKARGIDALDLGDGSQAGQLFEWVVELNPGYAPASSALTRAANRPGGERKEPRPLRVNGSVFR